MRLLFCYINDQTFHFGNIKENNFGILKREEKKNVHSIFFPFNLKRGRFEQSFDKSPFSKFTKLIFL